MPNHPSWGYQQTKEIIHSIRDPGLQTYARIGYLLGGRIMENLPLLNKQVQERDGIIIATLNTLKTRRGKYIFRELPNDPNEERFYCQALIDFKQNAEPETPLEEYLGIGGKRSIEKKLRRTIDIVPHSLRHLRATHMGHGLIPSTLHQTTAAYLKHYFGWANIAVANEYIDNLTINDILQQRQKRVQGFKLEEPQE